MCVYTITNKLSGKTYVGQTTKLAGDRWYKHAWNKEGSAISAAINKYGLGSFDFAVIDIAESIDQLNHKEDFWVKRLKAISPFGYNLLQGGKNRVPSEETREKQSAAKRGRPSKPEHVEKRTLALRAYYAAIPKKAKPPKVYVDKQSIEFRAKMSAAKRGTRIYKRTLNTTNRTGKSGVFFRANHGPCGAFSAHAMVDGKLKSKTFGCMMRGKDEAFRLACAWRVAMEQVNGLTVIGEFK